MPYSARFLGRKQLAERRRSPARRYADYLAGDGFTTLNTISSIGAFLLGMSTIAFLCNVWRTARRGISVEIDDPWGYPRSLGWATSGPPPRHNFIFLPRFDFHHQIPRERTGAFGRRGNRGTVGGDA